MARKKKEKRFRIIPLIGTLLMLTGVAIVFFTFAPIFSQEISYLLPPTNQKAITPVDTDFGILIPKIGANARVIADVDPYDSRAYQYALTKGVAHAKGTSTPGSMGNIFLFAHSSEDFYNAVRYNSIFYLINKLESGDEIYVYYKNTKYAYVVTDKKFVDAKDVSYLQAKDSAQTLTLMTCWPPGTTFKRFLVFAKLTEQK